MNKNVLVYLSGPITPKEDWFPEDNVLQAFKVHMQLVKLGIPNICVHLVGAFPSAWHIDWRTWLDFDLALIERCTHMLMLERWQASSGAVEERERALELRIPVAYSVVELLQMVKAK